MALLRTRLEAARPGVPWAEEIETDLPETGECWVVDPLDGAVQYLQGLPQWSISVALIRDGRPVLAVLHSAVLGQTYTAVRGRGAFLDAVPIAPSAKTILPLALVATSQPPFVAGQLGATEGTARALARVLPAVGVVRNLGPTSWQIADVASGRIDAFYEYGHDAGNLLAASLVADEPEPWSPTPRARPGSRMRRTTWPPHRGCTPRSSGSCQSREPAERGRERPHSIPYQPAVRPAGVLVTGRAKAGRPGPVRRARPHPTRPDSVARQCSARNARRPPSSAAPPSRTGY